MKIIISIFVLILLWCNETLAQEKLEYSLRLEPVWSRVADVLGEAGSIESAEFSPDGRFIVSGSKYDNSVIMWRTSDGAELWRQYTKHEIERVGWSGDGKYVASCSEDRLATVFDAKSGDILLKLEHEQGIDGLTWSKNGNLLATGEEHGESVNGSTDGWIRIFKIPSGEEVKSLNFGGKGSIR